MALRGHYGDQVWISSIVPLCFRFPVTGAPPPVGVRKLLLVIGTNSGVGSPRPAADGNDVIVVTVGQQIFVRRRIDQCPYPDRPIRLKLLHFSGECSQTLVTRPSIKRRIALRLHAERHALRQLPRFRGACVRLRPTRKTVNSNYAFVEWGWRV